MRVRAVAQDPDISIAPPERIARPVMIHDWTDLALVHWPIEAAVVQALLPPELEVDRFEEVAWLGVVPFRLGVRLPPWFPPIPGVSETPEVNVRTYVRGPDGRRGIWFLSLDAAALPSVALARLWYRLPYRPARMRFARMQSAMRYRSVRRSLRGLRPALDLELALHGELSGLSDLDRFLTCRWRMYSPGRRGIFATQIDHDPWQLYNARVDHIACDLLDALGLPPVDEQPRALFSPGVRVRFDRRRPIAR